MNKEQFDILNHFLTKNSEVEVRITEHPSEDAYILRFLEIPKDFLEETINDLEYCKIELKRTND